MDIVTYALCKKLIESAVSGITDIKVVNNKTQEEIKCTIELEGDNYILIKDIDSSLDGKEVKIIFTAK